MWVSVQKGLVGERGWGEKRSIRKEEVDGTVMTEAQWAGDGGSKRRAKADE